MERESRVKKTMLNARVNMICYFASLVVAFFTRKIFLDELGTEFIGLTGTLQSLLGFLNLAELGVGGAIGYVLYKPIFDADKTKINEIISVFGYLYRCIGLFILGTGCILSCFLPLIFSDTNIPQAAVFLGFYAYLASSLLGYFANYKQTLLSADQRNYVVTGYFQAVSTTKVLIQMALALYVCSFYLYFIIELAFGIVYSIVLQWKIRETYPWLKSEVRLGKQLFKKYPEIGKYIKQLFVHQIGGFVQFQLSPFLIYAYVSLPVVALYGNYTLVSQRMQSFLNAVLSSTGAGVGNLISEGNKDRIYSVYTELLSFRTYVAGIFAMSIFILIDGFIETWLGGDYILSRAVVVLVCIQFFLTIIRDVNIQFLYGYGLFHDTWAPLVESCLFVAFAMILGSIFGLEGVLLGPIVSSVIIIHIWKPYFLFRKGFHYSIHFYWIKIAHNLAVLTLAAGCAVCLYHHILDNIVLPSGWLRWILQSVIFASLMVLATTIGYYCLIPDFRRFIRRFVAKGRYGK